jgi:hypothetical protein
MKDAKKAGDWVDGMVALMVDQSAGSWVGEMVEQLAVE